jgi:hypothetical protein
MATPKTTLFLAAFAAAAACTRPEPAQGSDAGVLLARFKAVTGGARWDAIASLETRATMSVGQLSGPVTTLQDVATGRAVSQYTLGPVSGAEGYDGTTAWSRDPGGEVVALDAPEARETAKTGAWINALAYWYPGRAPGAVIGEAGERAESGRRFQLLDATPRGGRAIALWFDADTGLLVRTVQRRGSDTITTAMDDYRDAAGVRLPFHVVVDQTDAAGRTDARARVEIHVDQVVANVQLDAAAFAMPAMTASARIADPSGTTQVPFELVNNHIYAAATIDGKPARVVVDTGGLNLLTPMSAQRLGVASSGKLAARGVGDEEVDLALGHAGEVRLGAAVLAHPVFYILDLGELQAGEGTEVDGLVGYEMFRRFRVTIDYAARLLTLTEPARFAPPAGAHVVPFELADRIPIVTGSLDGLPVRLSVDTGSRASLTLHAPFVRDHDLAARYGAAPETIVGWGVGGPSRGRPARLGALALGDLVIADIAGDLYTGDKGAFADPDRSGNLGGGVLRRFTVTFDYDAHRMYLTPNSDFGKPDDFDRSGLWLFADGDALKVVAVAPDGPSSKAGVAANDRIERISDEPVRQRTLAEWRQRLRSLPAGAHVALSVVRGGAPQNVDLVLADVIPQHAR